jgi:glycosyltransferase involved in cell wall biosynthesis
MMRAGLRILFQTEIVAMGGAERSLLALARWLHMQGEQPCLLTYVDHAGIAAHAGFPLQVIELRPKMSARSKVLSLRHYFSSAATLGKPLLSGYQSAMHASLAGLRGTHCLMHDTPDLFEDGLSSNTLQRLRRVVSNRIVAHGLRSGGHTIVTSEHLKRQTRRLFGVEADIVRMGGIAQPNAFHLRPSNGKLRLLSVSRIEANKRIDWILRSLAHLESGDRPLSARVDWVFDVVGKGAQMEELRHLAEQLGLSSRVRFHGYVEDETLKQMYAEAHLFLMPAVQGYGIPAIEALQQGLPVLLHRESGVSDILAQTPWATMIEGGEENMLPAMTRAIDDVIEENHFAVPPPDLPTEDEWAERVATLCGWTQTAPWRR